MNNRLLLIVLACLQLFFTTLSASVFDKTNANMWVINEKTGQVSSYVYLSSGGSNVWTESFNLSTGGTVYTLGKNEQVFVNNLATSSQLMSTQLSAISIADLGKNQLTVGENSGNVSLGIAPLGGNYSETIAVELSVDETILELGSATIHWSIVNTSTGTSGGTAVINDTMQSSGGRRLVRLFLVEDGDYTITVKLDDADGSEIAQQVVNYKLTASDPEGQQRDSDNDGLPDLVELALGLDPLLDDWQRDSDGNGWSDFDQWLRKGSLDSNGVPIDRDNDGWSDFDENLRGTNPNDTVQAIQSLTTSNLTPTIGTQRYKEKLQLFRDVPAAKRLYEVEYLLSATVEGISPGTQWHSYSSFNLGDGITYSSDELLSADDLLWVSIRDAGSVPERRKHTQLRTLTDTNSLNTLRLAAGESQVLTIEGKETNSENTDESRNWQILHWLDSHVDITPLNFDGGTSWTTTNEWRTAYIAHLQANLVETPSLQLNQASTTDALLLLSVITKEYKLAGKLDTPTFNQRNGATASVIKALRQAVNRHDNGRNFSDVLNDLKSLSATGMTMEVGRIEIKDSYASLPWNRDSLYNFNKVLKEQQAASNSKVQQLMYLSRFALFAEGADQLNGNSGLGQRTNDSDSDGLSNEQELLTNIFAESTKPWENDSDGDGVLDNNDECPVDELNACSTAIPTLVLSGDMTVTVTTEGGFIIVTAQINRASDQDISIDFNLDDGTAIAGLDYTDLSGTLVIPAGELSATFIIELPASAAISTELSFNLVLTNPQNVTLAQTTYGFTIFNTAVADNADPVANNQTVNVYQNSSAVINLIGNDEDGDNLTYSLVNMPANGLITGTLPNITYTATIDYLGTDSFSFLVNDGTVDSNVAVINLTITERPLAYTEIVSINSDGVTQSNAHNKGSHISADGRFIVFDSCSYPTTGPYADSWDGSPYPDKYALSKPSLLVTDETGASTDMLYGSCDVFLRDRSNNTTEIVSLSEDNEQVSGNNSHEGQSSVSNNGNLVIFQTKAKLVSEDTNNLKDIYVRDRINKTTQLVSVATDIIGQSAILSNGDSKSSKFSPNGRYVLFESISTTFSEVTTNLTLNVYQLFVRDLESKTTTLITVNSSNEIGSRLSYANDINDYGDVVFTSRASNVHSNDYDTNMDVYVRRHDGNGNWGDFELISVNSLGQKARSDFGAVTNSESATISSRIDGNLYVVFMTRAANLIVKNGSVISDTNEVNDIFLRNLNAGTTEIVSVNTSGEQTEHYDQLDYEVSGTIDGNKFPEISADGKFVAWISGANNLVIRDDPENRTEEVYLRDLVEGTTEVVSISTNKKRTLQDSSIEYITLKKSQSRRMTTSASIGLSEDGSIVVFSSLAENLVPELNNGIGDTNFARDIFVRVRGAEPANAPEWVGDEITATVTTPSFPGQSDWTESTATVSLTDVEFSRVDVNVTTTANFDGNTLTLTYENTSSQSNITYPAQIFDFTDLNVKGGIIALVELYSNFSQLINASFTETSITLNVGMQNTNPDEKFIAIFEFTPDAVTSHYAPVADSQTLDVDANIALSITLTGSDTEAAPLFFRLVTPPSNGVLTGELPELLYTPNVNYIGIDSFSFVVNDGEFTSNIATVELAITGEIDFAAPTALINFPPTLSITDEDKVIVSGKAVDDSSIASIRVNGVSATTTDGFANWQVSVPLEAGNNALVVETSDVFGNINSSAGQVDIERTVYGVSQIIAHDKQQNRLLMYQNVNSYRQIISIDLSNGARTNLTFPYDDVNEIQLPRSVAVDSTLNRLIFTDSGTDAVVALDLVSGIHTIISSFNTNLNPTGLVLDTTNKRAFTVIEVGQDSEWNDLHDLIEIDLDTGNRTVVSSNTTQLLLDNPEGIAADFANNRIFILDVSMKAVIAVDLTTGIRSIFSDNNIPNSNNNFSYLNKAIVDYSHNRLLVTDKTQKNIMAVDLDTGARTIVSDSTLQTDNVLLSPSWLGIANETSRLLILDTLQDTIMDMDLADGTRSVLSDTYTPDNILVLNAPTDIEFDSTNERLLIANERQGLLLHQGVYSVDQFTGNRSIISARYLPDENNLFNTLKDIELDLANNRVLALDQYNGLMSVKLDTGLRTPISNNNIPSYPDNINKLNSPDGLLIDPNPENNRAFVTVSKTILAVDLTTGARTIFSDASTPDANNIFSSSVKKMVLDSENNRLIVNAYSPDYLYGVDLTTGARTILSSTTYPDSNYLIQTIKGLVLDKKRSRILMSTSLRSNVGNKFVIVAVDLSTGKRSIFAENINYKSDPDYLGTMEGLTIDDEKDILYVVQLNRGIMAISLITEERVTLTK